VDAALTLTALRCAILLVSKHKLKDRASMEEVMCLGPAIDTPSPLPARTGDGVGYSAEHLVA
jgi:hypothetical protein